MYKTFVPAAVDLSRRWNFWANEVFYLKIGILGLQGAVREHFQALQACGAEPVEVLYREQFDEVNGLIIPGGESTTVGKLLVRNQMLEPLIEKGRQGFPIFGTCTGMILLAKEIEGSDQPKLGLMNIKVNRNAFGRQIASFESDLTISGFATPFPAVFIRAPYINQVAAEVKILSKMSEKIVFAQEGKLLAAAFHPELTKDLRVHQYFLEMCQ